MSRAYLPIKQVRDLRPGDRPDLCGDIFADPDRRNVEFDLEYPVIERLLDRGPTRVGLVIDGSEYALPSDHYVRVFEE